MKYIHSGKFYPFKEIYVSKEHIFVQVRGHMFTQGNYIYWTLLHSRNSRNIYSKILPSHFMIIRSFTITISWIKYSYNFFSVEGWRNCWYDRGFCIIITVRVVFAIIVRRNTTRCASRFRHCMFAKSDVPASEPFISKGTIEHSSNCEFLLKIYDFLSFWKSLSSTKLIYTQTLSAQIYALTFVFNADVSENTLPFVSQSISNFSDYDISQTHDWECPSLSPHVLLAQDKLMMVKLTSSYSIIMWQQ